MSDGGGVYRARASLRDARQVSRAANGRRYLHRPVSPVLLARRISPLSPSTSTRDAAITSFPPEYVPISGDGVGAHRAVVIVALPLGNRELVRAGSAIPRTGFLSAALAFIKSPFISAARAPVLVT